jgi:hypothetical protein
MSVRLSCGPGLPWPVLGLETLDDIAILTGLLNPPVNSALS